MFLCTGLSLIGDYLLRPCSGPVGICSDLSASTTTRTTHRNTRHRRDYPFLPFPALLARNRPFGRCSGANCGGTGCLGERMRKKDRGWWQCGVSSSSLERIGPLDDVVWTCSGRGGERIDRLRGESDSTTNDGDPLPLPSLPPDLPFGQSLLVRRRGGRPRRPAF